MSNTKLISVSKETVYYLTNFFPLAFSMAICFGFGTTAGILFGCLAILLSPDLKSEKIMPLYTAFIILGCNADVALPASLISLPLVLITHNFFDKIKKYADSPAFSGVMLGTALTSTVLFTTDYFGIGATGETVTDMIKSYISLGFHPNWRGVLYGTIVMVVMITFPRKFKSFSKTVSAAFIAIGLTLVLNLFLNPEYMPTAIAEIGKDGFVILKNYIFARFNPERDFLRIFICGVALYLNYVYSASNYHNNGALLNLYTSGILGIPLPYGINRNKNTLLSRFLAAGIVMILFAFLGDYIGRIPLHSCAVVVIVGAWQNVKWSELKKSFSGIIPVLMFTVSVVCCIVFDLSVGITVSAALSVIYHKFLKKAV